MKKHAWLIVVALLAGCGGGSDDATDETTDTSGGEDGLDAMDDDGAAAVPGDTVHASAIDLIGINPPAATWDDMSHGDREMDMVSRFHPIFRELFNNHDGERYAEFGCGNCHGEDMSERDFAMPSLHLPPVAAAGSAEYEHEREEHPEMVEFMETDVTPAMQTMLGEADFTCNGCHPTP